MWLLATATFLRHFFYPNSVNSQPFTSWNHLQAVLRAPKTFCSPPCPRHIPSKNLIVIVSSQFQLWLFYPPKFGLVWADPRTHRCRGTTGKSQASSSAPRQPKRSKVVSKTLESQLRQCNHRHDHMKAQYETPDVFFSIILYGFKIFQNGRMGRIMEYIIVNDS